MDGTTPRVSELLRNLKTHADAQELQSKALHERLEVTDPASGRSLTVVVCVREDDAHQQWFFAVTKSNPAGSPIAHATEASTAALRVKRLLIDQPADVSAILSGNGLAAPLVGALAEAGSIAQTIARENGHLTAEVVHAAIQPLSTDDLTWLRTAAALLAAVASATLEGRK